ncbi:MAG: TIGR00282 family metallophosphoesterase [Phycisphaerae bacterium]|nr:TIGR00282 family metallophosphoesterase [Phycisphaerae bacterium]
MNILCIGDVVGKPGRKAIEALLAPFVKARGVDAVIANCENAAAGSGLTEPLFSKLRHHGVDAVTLGDHVYRKRDVYPLLEESDRVVRPANLPERAIGRPVSLLDVGGVKVAFFCLLGQIYMKQANSPFAAADAILGQLPPDVKVSVVDVHAEATSEKVALGHYLTGRASIVFGTHTHIATADECILGGHTAYITDVGMTGPYDSVLGRDKKAVVESMVTGMPFPFDVAERDARLSGLLVSVDPATGAAQSIERIQLRLPDEAGQSEVGHESA